MITARHLGPLLLAALFGGATWTLATPAKADHCYHISSGMIYCYDTLPASVTHHAWPSSDIPPLSQGQAWECNLMSHPRTICVSFDPASEPPVIPKYLADDEKFGTENDPPES